MSNAVRVDQPADVLVSARGLVKHFVKRGGLFGQKSRAIRAVNDVSLDIKRMETLGVVGESGCGKTTLARCILRLIEPTAGQVYFEGKDILKLPPGRLRELRRDMQIVFQNPFSSLDGRMSVLRIVGEPLRAHTSMSQSEICNRVVRLLEQVGMAGDHLYRYAHEFSGGQLQRIAIARALALNPKFLVLDEPTAALDVSVQAQIITLLMELQQNLGLTYLFISHNLTLVHYLSDAIAVQYLGEIVEHATADEVFGNPQHPYTQALLSSTPSLDPLQRQERIILTGGVPDPANPPPGCAFHPRCPIAVDYCSRVAPRLLDAGDGRLVSCHVVNRTVPSKEEVIG